MPAAISARFSCQPGTSGPPVNSLYEPGTALRILSQAQLD